MPMVNALLIILYLLALYRLPLLLAALSLHAALILRTAWAYGRIPLVGLHDTLDFLAFSLGVCILASKWERKRELYAFSIPLIVLLIAGSLFSPPMTGHLPPVLKTIWFELHVVLSFVSYALFALGAVFGILWLAGKGEAAEHHQYRALLLGYVLFSLAMIFGGIWAFYAWGSYWLWTPKELWTTIVWFWYSLYLHARLVRGWSGQRVVWLGIIGFLVVMFTYAGVGLLMKSSHEF
ncbi:MAG TPA: cytochrome c biogenesis protein CcsA [Nitrospirota bacterium]|nr:cytochrome c biogenesis protein CcsA [Nitrospirota bacterium]